MSIGGDKIKENQQETYESMETKRITVEALEEILYKPLPVLDHGFIRVVDYMGSDASVVQAARVSYGKGTKQVSQDRGLINYLMSHHHSTPFEMCELKLHIKLPIFVARQWIRHRTASVNEYSARYSILDKEFYIPAPEHLAAQSSLNRQGRSETLTGEEAQQVYTILREDALKAYEHYQLMLGEKDAEAPAGQGGEGGDQEQPDHKGLARELARINLPVSFYTQWYWKIDLHNLMHFLRLRGDPHAQYEIRAYADVMLDILKRWVPLTFEAFVNHRLEAAHLSAKGLAVVKRLIKGETVTQPASGLSQREWGELMTLLDK